MASSASARPKLHKAVSSSSEEETRSLGRSLGIHLKPGDWVVLVGELGTGKTQFVKGIAEALGCKDPATSPTFALAQIHAGAGHASLRHVDLYRLSPRDVPDLGWDELFDAHGVTAVEWAEKARGLWPVHAVEVRLTHDGDNRRTIQFFGGERAQELARKAVKDTK